MDSYADFLQSKVVRQPYRGKEVSPDDVHPLLFDFQRDVTAWAVRKGRAAVFLDTGLGKTLVAAEWVRLIGEKALIIAPLSVARQTVKMVREKLDRQVNEARAGGRDKTVFLPFRPSARLDLNLEEQ